MKVLRMRLTFIPRIKKELKHCIRFLRIKIDDPCGDGHVKMYKNYQVRAIDNIYYRSNRLYVKMLEQFAWKAGSANSEKQLAPRLTKSPLLRTT